MKARTAPLRLITACLIAIAGRPAAAAPAWDGAEARGGEPVRVATLTGDLGIGVHMGGVKGPYGQLDTVVADIAYLGVHHVRDSAGGAFSGIMVNGAFVGSPDLKFKKFAAAGVTWDLSIGQALPSYLPKIEQYAQYIESVEGPNEPEFTPVTYQGQTGLPAAAAAQKDLYRAIKADPALLNVKVLNLPFAHPATTAQVEPLAAAAEFANLHSYAAHGDPPGQHLRADIDATVDAPGRPLIITETGYPTNSPSGPPAALRGNGHSVVDEDVQAKYLLDTVFDAYAMGAKKTYFYELFDERADPQNADPEAHFGFFRVDMSPKPVAVGFHNLLSILADPGADADIFRVRPLDYQLPGGRLDGGRPDAVQHLLMQKSDGRYELALWTEPRLWGADLKPVPPAPIQPTPIVFDRPHRVIRLFDPLVGATPQAEYHNADRAVVPVGDHPLILEISPD